MAAGGGERAGARASRRREPRSDARDLGPRILVAIPALAFAGLIVGFGGWVFAAGLFVLGAICLHELFAMFTFTNPSRLAGFIGLAGLIVAAEAGGRATVLLAFVMCVPLVFLLSLAQANERHRSDERDHSDYYGEGRAIADMILSECFLIGVGSEHLSGVGRAAAGHDEDDVEDTEAPDEQERDDDVDHARHLRHGHIPETLPGIRPIDGCRLQKILADVL